MNDSFNELTLSNYWDGRFPDTGFARKSYTNRIFGYIGNKLIKVLFGQRGAGKSYLLRQIMVHLLDEGVSARNVLYISRSFTDSGFISGRGGLEDLLSVYRERLHPWGRSIYSLKKYRISMVGRSLSVHIHKITSIVANCLSVVRTGE